MAKIIRLTESDLHAIVENAVNQYLSEAADTPRGQYYFGAASKKLDDKRGKDTENHIDKYARKRRKEDEKKHGWDDSNSVQMEDSFYDGYQGQKMTAGKNRFKNANNQDR